MSVLRQSQLLAMIEELLADNCSAAISPSDTRRPLLALLNTLFDGETTEDETLPATFNGATFSNLSGDYGAFSRHSNAIAYRIGEFWFVWNRGVTAYVGKDSSGGAYMANFMWADSGDQFWWLAGVSLQLRAVTGEVVLTVDEGEASSSIELPATIDGRLVSWRSGSGSGSYKQFAVGYDQAADQYYIQWFDRTGVKEGYWFEFQDALKYHNAHVTAQGLAFQPQGVSQAHSYLADFDGSNVTRLETSTGADDWVHETWDGNKVAFWDNPSGEVRIEDFADKDAPTLIRSIAVEELALLAGESGEYVQYQHGDYRNGRLLISAQNITTELHSIFVWHESTDTIELVEKGIECDRTTFQRNLLGSISHDGSRVCWHATREAAIRTEVRGIA